MRYCKKCGNSMNDGDIFCGNCGENNSIEKTESINKNQVNSNSKKNSKMAIIVLISVILILFIASRVRSNVLSSREKNDLDNNKVYNETIKSYKLNKITLKYDSSVWKMNLVSSTNTVPEKEGIMLSKGKNEIVLSYYSDNNYLTSKSYGNSLLEEIEEANYNKLTDLTKVYIDGMDWYVITFEKNGMKYLYASYSYDYDKYDFQYSAPNEEFDNNLTIVSNIMEDLKYDKSDDIKSEKKAKEKLIGEWDWGEHGYFVFTDSLMYWYKDNSRDEKNVYYGTYKATDKIKTYGSGYREGMDVIFNIDTMVIDGEVTPYTDEQREFAFIPGENGEYTIQNLVTMNSGSARKVR